MVMIIVLEIAVGVGGWSTGSFILACPSYTPSDGHNNDFLSV